MCIHACMHTHIFCAVLFLWSLLSWFAPLKSLPLGMFAHLDLCSVTNFFIKYYILAAGFLPAYVDHTNYQYLKLVQQDLYFHLSQSLEKYT